MKFVHAADIHLDSPLLGLEAYESAPVDEIRVATRRAFEAMIGLCLDEEVDFLVIAGDLYDGEWRDFNTGLYFVKQMSRLREADIRAFILRGNHDAKSRNRLQVPLPENVQEFEAKKPETIRIDDLQVALHGQSFAEAAVTENLAVSYPAPVRGWFNIGVLHTCLTGGHEGHEDYAPCTIDQLVSKGYDYWALGHVHGRNEVHRDPLIVFPGNLQGRNIREKGEKGCTLVEVEDGNVVSIKHCAVDVVRWTEICIDATGAATPDVLLGRTRSELESELDRADGRLLAVRVTVEGCCPAHEALYKQPETWTAGIRAIATDLGYGDIWVEKVRIMTRPETKRPTSPEADDALSALVGTIASLRADSESLAEFARELDPLMAKLPAEVREGKDSIRPEDTIWLDGMLDEAFEIVSAQLLSEDE